MTQDEGPAGRLLEAYLVSADLIAQRLAQSCEQVASLMPLDAGTLAALPSSDILARDALLFRFTSLVGLIQDHVIRSLLVVQEEVRDRTRKDQRLLMEKLGAFPASVDFGALARLRNRVMHPYPHDRERRVAVLNNVFALSRDLLDA